MSKNLIALIIFSLLKALETMKVSTNGSQETTLWNSHFPIEQVVCETLQNSVLCGIRHKRHCSLLDCDFKLGESKMLSQFSSEYNITDIGVSPYVPGEIIFTNDNGILNVRSANSRNFTFEVNLAEEISSSLGSWFGSKFSSHPRCVIGVSSKQVSMYDIRSSANKVLQLLTLPVLSLPSDEQIHNVLNYSHNEHCKFLVTSQSLLLVDERFPNELVLKWSHTVNGTPTLASIARNVNTWNHLIVVGSCTSQDTSVIHLLQDNLNPLNIYSQCSSFKASKPSDNIENLLQMGHYSAQIFLKRISLPLAGLCIFPTESSGLFTVLQLTQAGDLFSQKLSVNFKLETSPKVTLQKAELNAHSLKELEKWNRLYPFTKKNPIYYSTDCQPNKYQRASKMMRALAHKQMSHGSCSFCKIQISPAVELASSGKYCIRCGINVDIGKRIRRMFDMGRVINDSSLNKPTSRIDLNAFGLEEKNWAEYRDQTSQNIMKIWHELGSSYMECNETFNVAGDNSQKNEEFFSLESFYENLSKNKLVGSLKLAGDEPVTSNLLESTPNLPSAKMINKHSFVWQINDGF